MVDLEAHQPSPSGRSMLIGPALVDTPAITTNKFVQHISARKQPVTDDHHDAKTYLARYAEHNSRLQNWIGAYGAGLASMLVYQFRTSINDVQGIARTATRVSEPSTFDLGVQIEQMHHTLAISFKLIALALGLQILLLFLNKTSQFALAHMDTDRNEWSTFDRLAEWFSQKYIFDAACDIASIGLLGLATLSGMRALRLIS